MEFRTPRPVLGAPPLHQGLRARDFDAGFRDVRHQLQVLRIEGARGFVVAEANVGVQVIKAVLVDYQLAVAEGHVGDRGPASVVMPGGETHFVRA